MKKVIDFCLNAKIYDIYCRITICELEVSQEIAETENGLENVKNNYCDRFGLDSKLFAIELI